MNANKVSSKFRRQLDSIRKKRIHKLRNKISSGKYQVKNIDLAKALFLSQ